MNISKPHAALLAAFLLVFGIFIGRLSVAIPVDDRANGLANRENMAAEADAALSDDEMIAETERSLGELEAEYNAAMEDLYSSNPPSDYRPDSEIQRGQRQAVELNEMICKQTGQNCEAAAMARRHYEENYGPM
ncbi:MAG: hypothetical protein IE932_11970 [Sphingopyxis terrae]|nr:hypothetical protein [Sphingopyxis terrae]